MKLPELKCHKPQADFINSDTRYTIYSGGRGAGKSFANCVKSIGYVGKYPNCTGMLCAPTYKMLDELLIRPLLQMATALKIKAKFNESKKILTFTNGSRILFRSTEDPENLRGPNLTFFGLDEACSMKKIEKVWQILTPTLREGGRVGSAWITTTPSNRAHYLYKLFYKDNLEDDRYDTFHCSTEDNPHLNEEFVEGIKSDYEGLGAFEKRELKGEWADDEDSLIKKDWITEIDELPKLQLVVRAWDLATSTKTQADFTASCLMGIGMNDDVYIIEATKDKTEWTETRQSIIDIAATDGINIPIVFEAVGMQLALYQDMCSALPHHIVHKFNPSKDKLTRALPVISALKNKKVAVLKGISTNLIIDELTSFGPNSDHDDVMDTISCAYEHLTSNSIPQLTFI